MRVVHTRSAAQIAITFILAQMLCNYFSSNMGMGTTYFVSLTTGHKYHHYHDEFDAYRHTVNMMSNSSSCVANIICPSLNSGKKKSEYSSGVSACSKT